MEETIRQELETILAAEFVKNLQGHNPGEEKQFEISFELNSETGKVENFNNKAVDPNLVLAPPIIRRPKFRFDLPTKLHIIVVGLGGTGGYVARDIGRLLKNQVRTPDVRLTFIDSDLVEEKNLVRQNFIEHDIGYNKATVLAERYSPYFGMEIGVIEDICTETLLVRERSHLRSNEPMLIIGCIDNNKGRREIHNFISKNSRGDSSVLGWIDAGNEDRSGQVILGTPGNFCSHYLPFVTDIFPDIKDKLKDPPPQAISCADRALLDIQNMFVNITAATHILNLLNTIFSARESSIHGVEFGINGAQSPIFMLKELTKRTIPLSDAIWSKQIPNI